MQGFEPRRPHTPNDLLWAFNRDHQPAPPGYAFNVAGQLVQLAYQPWMNQQQPNSPMQLPWESLDNPVYTDFAMGKSTIEMQPGVDSTAPPNWGGNPMSGHGRPEGNAQVASLVPSFEYPDTNQPIQDNGTLALTFVGMRGAVARTKYRFSKPLVGYIFVPSPDEIYALAFRDQTQPTPLGVMPTQANETVPPVGGAVAIAQISFGHLGAQFQAQLDVPMSQIIHVPFGGSFGQFDSMLVPKYFTSSSEANTTYRNYLVIPGGPVLTSAAFNTLTQAALPANGFTNPNAVPIAGYFTMGDAAFSNTRLTQPTRRFYGTVQATAAAVNPIAVPPVTPGSVTVCPVAWFASSVILSGNPGLNFFVRTFVPPVAAGVPQFLGPYPANVPINLPNNAESLLVYPTANLTQPGAAPYEVPFEAVFNLSF